MGLIKLEKTCTRFLKGTTEVNFEPSEVLHDPSAVQHDPTVVLHEPSDLQQLNNAHRRYITESSFLIKLLPEQHEKANQTGVKFDG